MPDILTTIVAHKREELSALKAETPVSVWERRLDTHPAPASMRASLAASPTGIIAEFKRRSPSKDWIKKDGDAAVIPPSYGRAGAAALSILTDTHFFGGALTDIETARPLTTTPILRKDFIIDEYQLIQARAVGANAALLIAACLDKATYRHLKATAHDLGLEILLEIHSEAELDYVDGDEDMIGVNNRNLGTFHTDVQNSFRLATLLPPGALKVSESGISSPATIRELREVGFRGFLIGECFMKTPCPADTLKDFIHTLTAC